MERGAAAKSFYFSYYAAMASLLPSLVLLYGDLGFSGDRIGTLTGLFPLMLLAGTFGSSVLADLLGRRQLLLVVLHMGAVLGVLGLTQSAAYGPLAFSVALFAFCFGPLAPVVDSTVLAALGEHKERYGRYRVWGVVGWGLAAPLVGALTERFGLQLAFWVTAGLLGLCLVSACLLPAVQGGDASASYGRPFNVGGLLNARWGVFLGLVFTGGLALAVCSNYVYLYLAALGASRTVVGLSLSVATLSELPFTLLGGLLLKRWAAPALLLGALVLLGVRLLLYPLGDAVPWVLAVQLLHGATFSVVWIAGVAYADALAPARLKVTAQGLFSAVMMGLGGASGGLLGGVLYGSVGAAATFTLVGAGVLVVAGGFFWLLRRQGVALAEEGRAAR